MRRKLLAGAVLVFGTLAMLGVLAEQCGWKEPDPSPVTERPERNEATREGCVMLAELMVFMGNEISYGPDFHEEATAFVELSEGWLEECPDYFPAENVNIIRRETHELKRMLR